MAASTIVVEGTVSGSRPYDIMEVIEGRTEARPFTAFAVGQLDWIKPSTPPPGDTVEFVIHSYERDLGDRIVRAVSPGDPTPKLGERYLLFLGPAGRPDVPITRQRACSSSWATGSCRADSRICRGNWPARVARTWCGN
jgi:hypothetical protein